MSSPDSATVSILLTLPYLVKLVEEAKSSLPKLKNKTDVFVYMEGFQAKTQE